MNCIYCRKNMTLVKTKTVFSQIKILECPNCKQWYYTPETSESVVHKLLQKIKLLVFLLSLNLIYVVWSVLYGSFDPNSFKDFFECSTSFVATIIVMYLSVKKYLTVSNADWLEYEE